MTKDERKQKVLSDLHARMIALARDGLSTHQIAQAVNRSAPEVSRVLRKHNQETRGMMRYGNTERAPETTVTSQTKDRWNQTREKLGHTQAEAIEESLRLYIEKHETPQK